MSETLSALGKRSRVVIGSFVGIVEHCKLPALLGPGVEPNRFHF